MKQGRANPSGAAGQKREPIPHAISPAAVSEIGIHQVRTVPVSLDQGRGYKAPPIASTYHPSGSQGKHK